MPILNPNNEDLLKLKVNTGVSELLALPDLAQIAERAQQAPIANELSGMFAWDQLKVYQSGAQLSMAAIASKVGVPTYEVFEAVLGIMGVDVVELVQEIAIETFGDISSAAADVITNALDSELLQIGAFEGAGVAIDAMSNVPIAGWIIKLAWSLAKAIKNIVEIARADGYQRVERVYPKSAFDPELDLRVLNDCIQIMNHPVAHDWTRFFSPPTTGPTGGLNSRWFANLDLEGGGFRIVGLAHAPANDRRIGMVPGTRVLHQGIEKPRTGSYLDIGTLLLPSAQSQLTWIWKNIVGRGKTAGAALYTIDATKIRERWEGYIYELHRFIYESDLPQKDKETVIKIWNGPDSSHIASVHGGVVRYVGSVFGWGKSLRPLANEWDRYFPVRECKIAEQRQLAFLDTHVCAYVDASFAALVNSKTLRDKWDRRRRDLLEHPSVCDVDLNSIPDVVYRERVKMAQQECRLVARPILGIPKRPPLPPRVPVPDGAPGAPGLDDEPSRRGRGPSTASLLGRLGMLAGAGFLAYKYGPDALRKLKR